MANLKDRAKKRPRDKCFTVYRDRENGNFFADEFGHDRWKKIETLRQVLAGLTSGLDGVFLRKTVAETVKAHVEAIAAQSGIAKASISDLRAVERSAIVPGR